jgi:hypothetical protein
MPSPYEGGSGQCVTRLSARMLPLSWHDNAAALQGAWMQPGEQAASGPIGSGWQHSCESAALVGLACAAWWAPTSRRIRPAANRAANAPRAAREIVRLIRLIGTYVAQGLEFSLRHVNPLWERTFRHLQIGRDLVEAGEGIWCPSTDKSRKATG